MVIFQLVDSKPRMCWVRFVFQHAHNAATLILLLKIHHRFSLKAWCVPWLIIFDLVENLMLWCLTDSIFHSHLFVFLIWILYHVRIIFNHHILRIVYIIETISKSWIDEISNICKTNIFYSKLSIRVMAKIWFPDVKITWLNA